jgi:hypothetical protein
LPGTEQAEADVVVQVETSWLFSLHSHVDGPPFSLVHVTVLRVPFWVMSARWRSRTRRSRRSAGC